MEKKLESFFENYLSKEPLFKDKKVLQGAYNPNSIPHRDEEINKMAGILAPSLRMDKPSNIFLYGKTGTGKTLVTSHVTENLLSIAEKNKQPSTNQLNHDTGSKGSCFRLKAKVNHFFRIKAECFYP